MDNCHDASRTIEQRVNAEKPEPENRRMSPADNAWLSDVACAFFAVVHVAVKSVVIVS
jgi:hypothetical protein